MRFFLIHRATQIVFYLLLALCAFPRIAESAAFELLYTFAPPNDGALPIGGLIQDSNGNFYGTTVGGGSNDSGTVYELSATGQFTSLWSMSASNRSPASPLTKGPDGYFYGTTQLGGVSNQGTVYKIKPGDSVGLLTLASFSGANGEQPSRGALVADSLGDLYGTTALGGAFNQGTVFKLSPNGVIATLVSFDTTNGATPMEGVIRGSDGNFYGTTRSGGTSQGTIFRLTPEGVLTNLAFLTGPNGRNPICRLFEANDGNFYGTTLQGGAFDWGTLFKMTPNGTLTTLVSLDGTNGRVVWAGLTQASDGWLYGVSETGGPYDRGTLFRINTNGAFKVLHNFDGTNGGVPRGNLIQATDGKLYGTASRGGAFAGGVVFRFTPPPILPPTLSCATNTTVECGTPWDFTEPSAIDDCTGANLTATILSTVTNQLTGGTFTATRTWVATDACGNSNTCSQTVTVRDTTPPLITCASNIIASEFPRDSGFASVAYAPPVATDLCDSSVSVTCAPPSGFAFPVGTNRVVCTATDSSGNSNSCAFAVRVIPYRLRIVTSTAEAGGGSLRQALLDANDAPGENMIVFEIPGAGPYVINVPDPLPPITSPLIIDGYSQTGLSNAPVIELLGGVEAGDGLVIRAGNSVVQGLVLRNFATAIRLEQNGGNVVRGNYIGTDVTGSLPLGNSGDGIYINCPTNRIGGTGLSGANIFSANGGHGVHVSGENAFGNLIQKNLIGTGIERTAGLGNGGDGVFIENGAGHNLIDGTPSGNTIGFNKRNGVGLAPNAGAGNAIRRNVISANGALGIDLGTDGVTANDAHDADSGPNELQNFPVLTDARSVDGITTIEGTLNDVPSGVYQLDFFINDTSDPSGFGEGSIFLGSLSFSVVNGGSQDFVFAVPYAAAFTQFVTATATDPANNTSEFSQARQVRTPPVIDILPDILPGPTPIGTNVTFCVGASGTSPIYYQWRQNGINLINQTNQCLTISSSDFSDGGSYTVTVYNDLGSLGTVPIILTLAVSNAVTIVGDNYADSVRIVGTNGFAVGANRMATFEAGEPLHAGKPGGKSVWYKWTPRLTGITTLRTVGSTFDTLLAIYTGPSVDTLTPVTSDEDRGGFFTSGLRFNTIKDTEYQIAIDGFGGDEGDFILRWTEEATLQLLPQIRTQPISQTVAPGATATFFVVAERVCGQGHLNCPDPSHFPDEELGQLDYQWFFNDARIPGETNTILVVSNVDLKTVGRYTAEITYQGRTIRSDDADLQINFFGSEVQQVRVFDKFLDAANSDPLQLGFLPTPAQVNASDKNRASAVAGFVSGYTGLQTFNNTGSTTESTETSCGTLGGASDWLKFIVADTNVLGFTTTGTGFDTILALYVKTNSTTPFKFVTCGQNSLTAPVIPGVQYLIGCDGVGGATGSIQLACNALFSATLAAIGRTPEGFFTLQVVGQPGIHFSLQGSSSLNTWSTILTTTSATGTTNIVDTTAAPFSSRFYRVQTLP